MIVIAIAWRGVASRERRDKSKLTPLPVHWVKSDHRRRQARQGVIDVAHWGWAYDLLRDWGTPIGFWRSQYRAVV